MILECSKDKAPLTAYTQGPFLHLSLSFRTGK